MVELIRLGDVAPTADRVAEAAGVGQRTVFRHFADMDSLYLEIQQIVDAKLMPLISRPYTDEDWRDRVREAAKRRAGVYEELMPFRAAADTKRYNSDFLMQDYRRLIKLERATLLAILPEQVIEDQDTVMALHMMLCFQCWRRLREDEDQSIEMALALISHMINAVIGAFDRQVAT